MIPALQREGLHESQDTATRPIQSHSANGPIRDALLDGDRVRGGVDSVPVGDATGDLLATNGNVLGAIEQVVASTPVSRIPQGVKVRIELTSNGGRYFIYRYTDLSTKKRKAIYGGPSRNLDPERIAQYEKRRKR